MNTLSNPNERMGIGGSLIPAPTTYAPHEMIGRKRDADGNTLAQSHAYTTPLPDDVALEETPYARVLSVLREMNPLQSDMLHGRWETELRPALRTIHRVRHEEEEALFRRNQRGREENSRIDAEQQSQFAACQEALQPYRLQMEELDGQINTAHRNAAAAVTRTGGHYNPGNPSEADVLRVIPRSLPVIAGDMGLPWPETDRLTLMHPLISHIATVGFGTLFGLSLGLILGFIRAGALLRHPFALVLFLGVGALWAYVSRYCLAQTANRASSRYYLGHGPRSWVPFAALTVLALILTLAFDAAIGCAGVLGLAHAQAVAHSLGGNLSQSSGSGASVLVALAFAMPYAGYAVWEGYLKGRYEPVMNRLKARQEAEMRLTDAQRRSDPRVQEALNRIADVKDGLRQHAEHEGRMREIAAPYLTKAQTLESQRLPVRDTLDEAAQQRVDQALHQARGIQGEWIQDFKTMLSHTAPASRR